MKSTPVRVGRKLTRGLGVARLAAVTVAWLWSTLALAVNPPTISLDGDNPLTVRQGDPYDPNNPGATADDPGEDGDLTDEIIVTTPPINTNNPGTYTVTYQVTDSESLTASVDRTVIVDAIPTILVSGDNPLTVLQDALFDPNNPGATANDPEDGNLTGSIVVDNPVNTAVPGDYIVTYSVTDSAGNNASATRNVTVNGAPFFTTLPIEAATEGVLYNYVAQTDDPDGNPRTVAPITVPDWLTFTELSNGRGRLRGTPTGADVGDNPVEIQVSDSVNPPVSQTFIIAVAAGGGVPTVTILGDNPLTVLQGEPYDPNSPGATASDPEDGDLSGSISIDNPVDTNVPGSYTVTYSVIDSAGNNASATRTVNVNGPPTFTSVPLTQATEAVEYLYQISASDPDGDPVSITAITWPAWLTPSSTGPDTAELRGTPSGLDVGPHSVEIRVTDSLSAPVSQTFIITVLPGAGVPEVTLLGETTVTIQQGDSFDPNDPGATASDPEDGDLTDQIVVTATPSINTNSPGTYTVTYSVTDSAGNAASADRILNVNGAPVIDSVPVTTADEDLPYAYNISASDPNATDTITITATCTGPTNAACLLPADWLSFQDNGNGTARLSGTPAQADVGNWSIELTAQDQSGAVSTPQTFVISVVNVNDGPVLDAPLPDQTAREDELFTVSVAGNFSDEDEDALSFDATGLPPSFSIDAATGEISGTPGDTDTQVAPVTAYPVVVTASDGNDSVTAGFVLNVENINDPPSLLGQAFPLVTDEDVDIQVTAASLTIDDPDPGEVFVVELGPGANYTLIGNGTRVLPDANYFGPLSVPATVRDSGGVASNGADLAITVSPVNDPPGGSAIEPQTATENVPFTLDIAAFFSDVEEDPLSFAASGLPPGLVIDSTGLISGTPTLGSSVGDYAVQLTVSDSADSLVTGFDLSVLRAGRADLAVAVNATPAAATINTATDWTITVRNNAPQVNVANVAVELIFSGEVAFLLDDPPDPACTAASPTQLDCTLGPVSGGGSVTLTVSGRGDQVGDVVVDATVSIPDPTPIDETPGNDSASGALSLSESVSAGAAQQLVTAAALSSVAADFDADGFVDLAVGTAPGETVMVHLNIVDPANENKRILDDQGLSRGPVASTRDLAAADLDGDGSIDLVAANGPGAASQVLLNDGAAGFQASPAGSPADNSRGVSLADVNGDMLIDIVFANGSPNPVFLNQGNGIFPVAADQTLGNAASVDVVAADILGDSLPDLVFANADGDAAIYRNNGGIFVFEATLPTGATSSVGAGDFDGDGLMDLVFGKASSDTADPPANPVFRNTAAGVFVESALLGASPTSDVLCQDVNLDGRIDIVTLNTTGAHQIYIGDGAGSFAPNPQQFAADGIVRGSFGDLNGDGRDDLAASGSAGNDLFLNDGLGNLGAGDITPPTLSLLGAREIQLDVGDPFNDEGATATDNVDGDISDKIVTTNPVDTAVVGSYTVTYNVVDNSGNAATAVTRTVRVGAITGQGGGGGGRIGPETLILLMLAGLLHLTIRQRIRRSMI